MAKYYSQLGPSWSGVQVGTICMMPKDENGHIMHLMDGKNVMVEAES